MVTLQQIHSIDPYEFEKLVAELWESNGYDTNVRSKSNDKAIDIDAERGGRTEKIQVKRYTKNNKIGSNEVRNYATIYQQTNANSVALVTSGEVTDPAREVAQDLGVNLTDGKELVQQLESSSVDISDYTDSSSRSERSSTADTNTSSDTGSSVSSNRRAEEQENEFGEQPKHLTCDGEARLSDYLGDGERVARRLQAQSKPIAIGSKSCGLSTFQSPSDRNPKYAFTASRILAHMPIEYGDDKIYSIPYQSVESVETHFGRTRHRMEVKTSDETYHLWITDLKNGKEYVKGVKQYLEQTIPLTEDTETLSSTNSSSSPERLAGEPSDNYWKLIKWHFYIVIISFLLYFTTAIIGGAIGVDISSFSSSPLYTSIAYILGFILLLSVGIGHISICYFISKDKYELDKYNDNIRTRHWLTLIVFTYLSQFLYLLFYPLARIIKDTSGSSATADSDGS
jgi:hypothetical protein